MSQLPSETDEAPWKQRFRAPITYADIAPMAPERGIAISNRSGVFQLYAWDVPRDQLTQLTERAEGVAAGSIAPDGRFIIAIADWTMNYEDSAETLKGYQRSIFGGSPDEQQDLYRRASPLTYVDAVTAPVLIIQGRNDTRTPARPIAEYERRMRELNKRIDVDWFEAGHGSYVVEQQIEHQELMHQFVDKVLDG